MENVEGMERFRTGSSLCILEVVSQLSSQVEKLLRIPLFPLIGRNSGQQGGEAE